MNEERVWHKGRKNRDDVEEPSGEILYLIYNFATHWMQCERSGKSTEIEKVRKEQAHKVMSWVMSNYDNE